LFLLSETNPASFDSRYFEPMTALAVLGVASPLWTWNAPKLPSGMLKLFGKLRPNCV